MKFTLTLVSDDRMILSTERQLTRYEFEGVLRTFDAWKKTDSAVLVLAECEVSDRRQAVVELDVRLDPPASEAEVRHERLLLDPTRSDDAPGDWESYKDAFPAGSNIVES